LAGKFDEGMGEDGVDDMMGDEQAGGTLRTGRGRCVSLTSIYFVETKRRDPDPKKE
jgi:hypothetical protein